MRIWFFDRVSLRNRFGPEFYRLKRYRKLLRFVPVRFRLNLGRFEAIFARFALTLNLTLIWPEFAYFASIWTGERYVYTKRGSAS